MSSRLELALVFALGMGAMSGCSDTLSCDEICEKMNACDENDENMECSAFCDGMDELANESGCTKEWDADVKCMSDNADKLCGEEAICETEEDNLGACGS